MNWRGSMIQLQLILTAQAPPNITAKPIKRARTHHADFENAGPDLPRGEFLVGPNQ
jgi:hypothetical protein